MNLENLKRYLTEDISRYVIKNKDLHRAKTILQKRIEQFLVCHGISDAEIEVLQNNLKLFVRIAFDDIRLKFTVDLFQASCS